MLTALSPWLPVLPTRLTHSQTPRNATEKAHGRSPGSLVPRYADNPGEIPRSFYVNYERPRDYPFFKNIWHTLLTGIKPCVGLNEKVQQDVKNKIANMAIKKQERLKKKEQRKQRRAERKLRRELKKKKKEPAQQN